MTSMMTEHPAPAGPPHAATGHPSEEDDIALFLAQADPVDVLAAAGYLAGHDGNLIVRELRAPQLRRALDHSICYAASPDVEAFYRGDEEPEDDWKRRRAETIRDHCALCPVRAACAELALRSEDTHGIRGGRVPEKLTLRLKTEHQRLAVARAADTRAARDRAARLQAAVDVQCTARQYLGGSVPADKRAKNTAAIRDAAHHRDTLVAAHRAEAGWTEAA